MSKIKFSILDEKPLGLASDHAGFALKEYIIDILKKNNISYKDFGTYSEERADYPDFAHKMANAIESGEVTYGIAICGTGNGINMVMNKHQKVRSALCWNTYIAKMSRMHNKANVLALPGRELSHAACFDMVEIFFNTDFEGGRHEGRVEKIACS